MRLKARCDRLRSPRSREPLRHLGVLARSQTMSICGVVQGSFWREADEGAPGWWCERSTWRSTPTATHLELQQVLMKRQSVI
jgi:hypothetical protein